MRHPAIPPLVPALALALPLALGACEPVPPQPEFVPVIAPIGRGRRPAAAPARGDGERRLRHGRLRARSRQRPPHHRGDADGRAGRPDLAPRGRAARPLDLGRRGRRRHPARDLGPGQHPAARHARHRPAAGHGARRPAPPTRSSEARPRAPRAPASTTRAPSRHRSRRPPRRSLRGPFRGRPPRPRRSPSRRSRPPLPRACRTSRASRPSSAASRSSRTPGASPRCAPRAWRSRPSPCRCVPPGRRPTS